MVKLVITDRAFVPQGEIKNFSDISYSRGLSKLASLGFKVRLDNKYVDRLATANGYVKMYHNNALRFCGPIVTAEERAERETQSLAIVCADAGWNLTRRVAGKSSTGTLYNSVTDRAVIAKAIIDALNAETNGETGISTSTYTLTSGSSITHKVGPYVNAMTALQELASPLDGFDWTFDPIENWSNNALVNSKIAGFKASTVIGTTKDNAVFEYGPGTRSNVLNYTKTVSRDQQATKLYHLGPDPSDVKIGSNSTAETTWGLLQDIVQADLSDATMRQKLVDEHAYVRGNPRTLIKMTPHIGVPGRVPQPWVDYDVGDTITFRAVVNKVFRFSGLIRVYGFTLTASEGFERVELQLEDDT